MDVKFVKPFFYRGRLWCWLANTGHWPDIGGIVPGGFSANATEVEQEGLRLPPVKLFKKGGLDAEILSIIFSNIRIADQRIGDIKAQAAALTIGERRLTALLDRYGDEPWTPRSPSCARGPGGRCGRRSPPFPTASTRARRSSTPTASSTSRCRSRCASRSAARRSPSTLGLVPAVPRPDEQRDRDHLLVDLPRGQARLPRRADQRRHVRAARDRRAGGDVPVRAVSAAGVGLRGRGQPADRRGGVQRAGAGDPRPGVRGAGGDFGQPRARRPRPDATALAT